MNDSHYFKLFASCIPVKGATRSTICDIQREKFYFIPNALCEILIEHKDKTFLEVKEAYDHEADEIIEEYFRFLIDKELLFFTEEPELFPDLDLTWKMPSTISNSIIDVNKDSDHDFVKIFSELNDLNCKALQLRFYDEIPYDQLVSILELTNDTRMEYIEVMVRYSTAMKISEMAKICRTFQRVGLVTVHNAPNTKSDPVEVKGLDTIVVYITDLIDSSTHCGVVHLSSFNANKTLFLEGQKHNTCLNRKISVDVEGNIKNCPTLKQSFGNINEVTFEEALQHDEFKKMWTINKNQIEVCKDCEFRFVCTDCRAMLEDPENIYSKPAKCSYDPYTASWTRPEDDPNHKFYQKIQLEQMEV